MRLSSIIALAAAFALLLAGAATPSAAMSADPCPMASMEHAPGASSCCDDHAGGAPGDPFGLACKPGMACAGAAATLPAPLLAVATIVVGPVDHFTMPANPPPSRTPDRTLRPPIPL